MERHFLVGSIHDQSVFQNILPSPPSRKPLPGLLRDGVLPCVLKDTEECEDLQQNGTCCTGGGGWMKTGSCGRVLSLEPLQCICFRTPGPTSQEGGGKIVLTKA